MIVGERESQGFSPTEDSEDYSGITNPGLLQKLQKYRNHLPEGQPLHVASVLRALAEAEGLPRFSEDRYSLTHNFKILFIGSRIIPMEKGGGKGLMLDNTGADLLVALGYFSREGGLARHNFTSIVQRTLGAVYANGRLATRFKDSLSAEEVKLTRIPLS